MVLGSELKIPFSLKIKNLSQNLGDSAHGPSSVWSPVGGIEPIERGDENERAGVFHFGSQFLGFGHFLDDS